VTSPAPVAALTVVPNSDRLDRTFGSLLAQSDTHWQWCVAVSPDAPPGTLDSVNELIAGEPRAVAVPGLCANPAALAGQALELARADAVAWLGAGDRLDPNTVAMVRKRLPTGAWLYTDEGAIDENGRTADVWFKPDYAPEWLRSQPYAVRLAVLPLDVVRAVGGVRPEARTAAWYDLVLRVAAAVGPPAHLAGPFYLHGSPGGGAPFVPEDPQDRCAVVARSLQNAGELVEVSPIEVGGHPVGQRVRRRLSGHPRISIVIPTRASSSVIHGFPRCHAVELIRSLWTAQRYPDLELVVVYDVGTTPAGALREIEGITGGDVVMVPFAGPFHFSRKCNAGALAASGEYLCFLNDDMEVVTPDWLHELASLLADPQIGAVGARLLFADGTLQHAGHEYNGGSAGHMMFRYGAQDIDFGGLALVTSERSGVTGACMLLRATDFLRVGGFSEEFPLSYNDVDLSLKIRASGLRILYTPHATLFHYESQTRNATVTEQERVRIQWRWRPQLHHDPYVNELLRIPMAGTTPGID
jgi:O-antigen biosynthesis protein